MTIPTPICVDCKFFNHKTWTCAAFPFGIPEIILIGENDHSEPLPEQGNSIVFEKKED